MYNIALTEQQMQALRVFLSRTNLNASEVGAFIDVTNVLQNAQPVQENKDAVKPPEAE